MNSQPELRRVPRLRPLAGSRTLFALSLAATSVSIFASPSARAVNITDNFTGGTNGTGTDLTAAANYSLGTLPTAGNDVILTNGSSALTANTSLTFGSLDVTNGNTYSISNGGTAADTLTLGGGQNGVGTNTGDLIFLSNNSTVALTGGTGNKALGVILASNGNFDVGSGSTLTVSSIISGAYSLTANGAGALTLSGANTFSGGLTVQTGTVTGTAAYAFGGTNGTGTVNLGLTGNNSATLLAGASANFPNPIVLVSGDTGTLTIGTTAAAITPAFTSGVTGTGNLTLSAAGTASLTFSTGSTINNAGTITNAGTGSGSTNITGVIGSNVTGIIQNSATSTLYLSGTNTFTGPVTIDRGTASFYGTSSTGTSSNTITLGSSTGGSATLVLANANITNPVILATSAAGTLTISSGATNGAFSGGINLNGNNLTFASGVGQTKVTSAITGASGTNINVNASGTVILSVNNPNFLGTTTVTAGTLSLTSPGSLPNSAITINGGTLTGNGTAAAGITLNSGGNITPGTAGSTGTSLNAGSLTFNSGGMLTYALSTTNATSNTLTLTGALTLGTAGTFDVNLSGGVGGDTYTLATFASSSIPATDFTAVGDTGTFMETATALEFTVAVPEPKTTVMATLLLLTALCSPQGRSLWKRAGRSGSITSL